MAGLSPYQTALDLKRPSPDWIVNVLDKQRVQAYNTYWDIYVNVKDAFSVILREDDGNEKSRRFVPAARTIIEATNRYLAKNPILTPMPLATNPDGEPIDADEALTAQLMKLINDFMKREEFFSKFASMKRWMLIRGDGLFHLTADDQKPEGQRLRLVELDPATYFTIPDPLDVEKVVGAYIVNLVQDDEGEIIAQRQSYTKTENGTVLTQLAFFERDKWDDRYPMTSEDLSPVEPPERFAALANLLAGFELPSPITTIPVYHYRNRRLGGLPFGLSELQGIETLLAGITQTATDEDIAVGLVGIGLYVTTSGAPTNDAGEEEEWEIAPASVLELENVDDKFERVQGVTTVAPLLDHLGMLQRQAQETSGTPDVAVGRVDVSVAESGIALAMQMAPILGKNEETERELKGKTEQMLYDLINMWLPAYEGFTPNGVELSMTFDDPLPKDRPAILKEILDMVAAKIISLAYAQELIKERLGFDIPADVLNQMAKENQTLLDSVGGRIGEAAQDGVEVA